MRPEVSTRIDLASKLRCCFKKKHTFHQKWQARAHGRLLSACKALAQIRKLLGVNVQISIAAQEVNVAG